MKVIATNLGERKKIIWKGKSFDTGIFKVPVASVILETNDVKGDAVVDRRYHGGKNKAVYAYNSNHYSFWKEQYADLDWDFGMFGENLTIEGLEETNLHLGDTFQVGEAIIAVSGHREPCSKLGMRFNDAQMVKKFWNTTKCGAYFKILREGEVKAGDELILIEKKENNKSVAELYADVKP